MILIYAFGAIGMIFLIRRVLLFRKVYKKIQKRIKKDGSKLYSIRTSISWVGFFLASIAAGILFVYNLNDVMNAAALLLVSIISISEALHAFMLSYFYYDDKVFYIYGEPIQFSSVTEIKTAKTLTGETGVVVVNNQSIPLAKAAVDIISKKKK